jgi:K+-transporting ATPase A subunit
MKLEFFKKTDSLPRLKSHDHFVFLLLIVITIIHFSIPLVATWDTAHYHNYLEILYGNKSWENWDVIRGPGFPGLIAGIHFLFGYSDVGMLCGTYLITVLVLLIAMYFIKELSGSVSIFISYSLLFVFLFLNPIFWAFTIQY